MTLLTPVSHGDVIDKITILQIKSKKINDKNKLRNVENELQVLLPLIKKKQFSNLKVLSLTEQLKNINLKIWEIEDKIRNKELKKLFDQEFIELARSIYRNNDKRAEIKKQINILTGSDILEEKSYNKY